MSLPKPAPRFPLPIKLPRFGAADGDATSRLEKSRENVIMMLLKAALKEQPGLEYSLVMAKYGAVHSQIVLIQNLASKILFNASRCEIEIIKDEDPQLPQTILDHLIAICLEYEQSQNDLVRQVNSFNRHMAETGGGILAAIRIPDIDAEGAESIRHYDWRRYEREAFIARLHGVAQHVRDELHALDQSNALSRLNLFLTPFYEAVASAEDPGISSPSPQTHTQLRQGDPRANDSETTEAENLLKAREIAVTARETAVMEAEENLMETMNALERKSAELEQLEDELLNKLSHGSGAPSLQAS